MYLAAMGKSVSNACFVFFFNLILLFSTSCFDDLIISPLADVQFLMSWCEA